MDITYTYIGDVDETLLSNLDDNTKLDLEIEINHAAYAIDSRGYVYPLVNTDNRDYFLLLVDLKAKLRNRTGSTELAINIYTDTKDICVGDVYELYACDLTEDHIPEKSYQLFWKLKFRLIKDTQGLSKGLSLTHAPVLCPSCNGPLQDYELIHNETNDIELKLIKRCINTDCWCHVYTALEQFIIIACNTNKYTRIVKALLNNKIVRYPHQLFDVSESDIISTGIYDKYAIEFTEFMNTVRGTIRISDYIRSLAYIDYKQPGFRLKSQRIDDKFLTISDFIDYILTIGNYFLDTVDNKLSDMNNNICRTFTSWKDQFANDIEEYMSIPAFLAYYTYFKTSDKNIYAAHMLEEYQVFASK